MLTKLISYLIYKFKKKIFYNVKEYKRTFFLTIFNFISYLKITFKYNS